MKKNANTLTDFEKLHQLLEEMSHKQKISDQKTVDALEDLKFKIVVESARTRQEIEKSTRAEIQVAIRELEERLEKALENMESRLNKRLTNVADLITMQLGEKIQNHEKRIKKVERAIQTA